MPHSKLVRALGSNMTEVSTGTFQCQMTTPLMQQAYGISLKTVIFSNNVYNIRTGINDTYGFYIDGGPTTTSVIPGGYYTAAQIAALMQATVQDVLDAEAPGATAAITFNSVKARVESTITGAYHVWRGDEPTFTLNPFIGLSAVLDSPSIPDGDTYTFPAMPNLYGLKSAMIAVHSQDPKTFLNAALNQGRFTNSIGVVPVDVPFGGLVTWNQFSLYDARCDFKAPQDLSNLLISILDADGNGIPHQKDHLLIEFMVYENVQPMV